MSAPNPALMCKDKTKPELFRCEWKSRVYLGGLYSGSLPSRRCLCSSDSLWRSLSLLCAAVLSGTSSSWLLTLADRLSVSLNTLQVEELLLFCFCFFVANWNSWLTTLAFQRGFCGETWESKRNEKWSLSNFGLFTIKAKNLTQIGSLYNICQS